MAADLLSPAQVKALGDGLRRIEQLDGMIEWLIRDLPENAEKWGSTVRNMFGSNRMHPAARNRDLGVAVTRAVIDLALRERGEIAAKIGRHVEVRDPPSVLRACREFEVLDDDANA